MFKRNTKYINKIMILFLLITFLPIGNTKTVKADGIDGHSTYYTKAIINEKTLSYDLNIEFDEKLWGKTAERKENIPWGTIFSYSNKGAFGFLEEIAPNQNYSENYIKNNPLEGKIDDKTGLIFSFPGFQRETNHWFGTGDNANQSDMNRAYEVSEKLVNNLNLLIKELTKEMNISMKDTNGVNDVDKFISTSIALRPTEYSGGDWAYAELNNNYQVWYALTEKIEDSRSDLNNKDYSVEDFIDLLPRSDSNGNLYAYLIRTNNGKVSKTAVSRLSPIIWAMPKGYINPLNGLGFNKEYKDAENKIVKPAKVIIKEQSLKEYVGDNKEEFERLWKQETKEIENALEKYEGEDKEKLKRFWEETKGKNTIPWEEKFTTVVLEDEKEEISYEEYLNKMGIQNYNGGIPPYALTGTKIRDFSDTAYMTIFHYSYFANYNYLINGVSTQTTQTEESGFVAKTIYSIFSTLLYQLKNLLGLEDIHDLIYNGGIRGTSTYEEGTMSSSWWNTVLKYHLIFQVIAWMLIGLAIAKILVELNFSTINPQKRMSIMETIQKLFTVGFMLALAIPIIRLLISSNNMIVDVFRTQAQSDGDAFSMNGSIASIFSYASYFGILVIINCMYIMRSIMIAILSASAPFFIMTTAFGTKGQGVFASWFKEITANIFMQSIHAFAFAFLFDVIDSGKTIERIIIFWSLIPIVDTFRSLIFQNSGSFASNQGQAMGNMVHSGLKQTTAEAGKGLINARTNRLAKKFGADLSNEEGGAGGFDGSSRDNAMMNKRDKVLKDIESEKEFQGKSSGFTKFSRIAGNGLGKAMKTASNIGDMGVSANLGDIQGFKQASKSLAETVGSGIETGAGAFQDFGGTAIEKGQDILNNRRENILDKDNISDAKRYNLKSKVDNHRDKVAHRDFLRTGGVGRVIDSANGQKTMIGLNSNTSLVKDINGENILMMSTGDLGKEHIYRQTVNNMKNNQDFANYMQTNGYSHDGDILKVHGATQSRDNKSAFVKGNLERNLHNYHNSFNENKKSTPTPTPNKDNNNSNNQNVNVKKNI